MRTTIDIADHLLIQVKKLAAERKTSLRALVEDALRLLIAKKTTAMPPKGKSWELPVCDAGKPLPGVDLEDTSKLLEIE